MSDYFNNIFDLIPKKTSKSGSIGDVVPKKKKQKAGGVTGMPNDEFSLDKFLSSESLVQDGLELPPSESTSTQRPIILTDQELKNKAQKGYVPTNREYLQNLGSTNTEPNVTDLVTSEPTTAQHVRSAIVNPAGTFGQLSRGEKVIPDLPQGINDVTGMLNPVWYMDKLSKGVGNLTRGEYGSAGWNFLAGVPAIGPVAKAGLAYKAASKTKKFLSAPKSKIFNQGTKSQYKVTNLDPNLKQAQTLLNPTMTNNFATKIIESSGKANSQAMYAKELAAKNAIVASMLKGNKNKSSGNSAKGGLGAMPGTFTRSSKIGTKSTYNPYFPKNITSPVVQSQPIAPWQMQDLPGLHLKSTMSQGPISKIIDKKGNVNVNQALAIINKESGGKEKVNLIKKSLGDDIPKKMDYNDFRKATQKQLIPLERELVNHSSNYGLNRIGFTAHNDRQLDSAISFADSEIKKLNNEIIKKSKGLEKNTGKELATQKEDIAELKETLRNFTLNKEAVLKQKNNSYENQTLLLSNKSKFGGGSDAHGNPYETLGHAHFFKGGRNTGTLNVTQIQSDAFQGPYNIMPKNSKNRTALEKIQRSLKLMEDLQTNNKATLNKMKTEGINNYGTPVHKYELENMEDLVKMQEQSNIVKRAEAENFSQKQLLAKNHEERYLQEIVDYAAKRGDVNKIRLPTSETAAKIQGYTRTEKSHLNYAIEEDIFLLKHNKKQNIPDEIDMNTGLDIRYTDKVRAEKIKKLESQLDNKLYYDVYKQTILKKYSKQPKRVKKLFGVEPKTVTGEKGNKWYEFDIPESFKKGKAEIKAYSATGAIGTGALLSQDK